ncbi:hypothetical protein PCE1_002992 [Barthelona sp. PCE]
MVYPRGTDMDQINHHMKPETLAAAIRNEDFHEKTVIVDVRDVDFDLFQITNRARHIPQRNMHPESFLQTIPSSVEQIVFYCAAGQLRSPKCQKLLSDSLHSLNRSELKVYYLQGGLTRFAELYNDLCVYT